MRVLDYDILILGSKRTEFKKKLLQFKKFRSNRDSANLILGSSLAWSMNAKQLGKNWFNFSNPNQNIYNNFKFVDYYSNIIIIDSIFISIQNSDFLPRAYYKKIDWNKRGSSLGLNNNYYIFEDMLVNIKFWVKGFVNNLKLTGIDLDIILNNKEKNQNIDDIYFNTTTSRNLDSLYLVNKQLNNRHNQYFSFLNDSIDTYYIDEFQSMCDSLGIKVFFISTPKSKYYHYNLLDNDFKEKNIAIKNMLKSLPIKFYDYEHLTVESNEKAFYRDEVHMARTGARFFTERIILDFLKN